MQPDDESCAQTKNGSAGNPDSTALGWAEHIYFFLEGLVILLHPWEEIKMYY